MTSKKACKVLVVSPGTLVVERQTVRTAIELLNTGFGDGAKYPFIPFFVEDIPAPNGLPTPSTIDAAMEACDVFILILHRQWGQKAPDSVYGSYMEDLFHRACERREKEGRPALLVFFKKVDASSLADPGPRLRKILDFKRELEEVRSILYKQFTSENEFKSLLKNHLKVYIRGYISPKKDLEPFSASLSPEAKGAIEKARIKLKEAAQRMDSEAAGKKGYIGQAEVIERAAVKLCLDAAEFALVGKLETARLKFAQAVQLCNSVEVLNMAANFYISVGELDEAEKLLHRELADFSGQDMGGLLDKLGVSFYSNGNVNQAEAVFRQSLALEEKLGRIEKIACSYSNLGNTLLARHNYEQAEIMFRKALELEEQLGRPEGSAIAYGNLGNLFKAKNDMHQAEIMFRKALELEKQLGRLEGMANNYCNLGVIFLARGDFEQAEKMFRESLEMEEKLGRLEGMAGNYCNLGVLFKTRGNLQQAEAMHRKSLEIEEKLGRLEGIAGNYCNLGNLFLTRGDFEQAEKMLRKSLEMEEKLGRLEGMASNYCNLGVLFKTRGDLQQAETMHRKSLAIEEKLGLFEGMATNYRNLGNIFNARGDLEKAEEMRRRSIEIRKNLDLANSA